MSRLACLMDWAPTVTVGLLEYQCLFITFPAHAGGAPDTLLLRRDDLLGPKFLDTQSSSALQKLSRMRGLASVKESVATLLGLIKWVSWTSNTSGFCVPLTLLQLAGVVILQSRQNGFFELRMHACQSKPCLLRSTSSFVKLWQDQC